MNRHEYFLYLLSIYYYYFFDGGAGVQLLGISVQSILGIAFALISGTINPFTAIMMSADVLRKVVPACL